MDFGFYYRPDVNRIAFHVAPSTGESPCCYDTIVSESRIASYIGIAKGELPTKEYFGAWRTFPDTCDWSWQETRPVGEHRTYEGIDVFEGAYPYLDYHVVPGWGGSMFEALMPTLFVPEEVWAPHSWAINHPLTVATQIHFGLVDAGYGYWGFSPANIPEGGYDAWGVDAIGMNPDGYPSNEQHTFVDHGFSGCPGAHEAKPDPTPADYTNGVVTPHAAFLALRWAPGATHRQPQEAAVGLRHLRPLGLPRLGERRHGRRLGLVSQPRPGDHHGRDRQRPGRRHAARRVRDGRRPGCRSSRSSGRSSSGPGR